ncbi:hypothetical protein B4U84_29625 [Westiellopsis prolifica IICB1]|nr:hypothetical protein B4U84_29625 [Westiellopsis prolifica IICB1]
MSKFSIIDDTNDVAQWGILKGVSPLSQPCRPRFARIAGGKKAWLAPNPILGKFWDEGCPVGERRRASEK